MKTIQWINVIAIAIWLLLSGFLWIITRNVNFVYVGLFGLATWGLVTYLFLKIYEIKFDDNKIIVRNIFVSREFGRGDFHEIETTIFSPMIYRISFAERRSYQFAVDNSIWLKSLLGGENLLEKLKAAIS